LRFIDRFTRDEVSAKVWWPLALVGLVALVVSVPLANRAADKARGDAAQRAAAVSVATIQPRTASNAAATDLSGVASQIVASDPTLRAVRVWDPDHRLVASSDNADDIGSGQALNDADIDRALAEGGVWIVTDRTMSGDAGPKTYSAYTAVARGDGGVVTQFEALDSVVVADVHHDWMWFRIVVGLATLLLFALALLSMREPEARIGAGVPFYAGNVPPWLRVLDIDRAVALEQAGDRAKDRLAGLQTRLEESERLRLKAEGELQQALTALGTGGKVAAPVAAPDARERTHPGRPTPEAAALALAAAEERKRARAAAAQENQRLKAAAAAQAAYPEPPMRPDDVTVRTQGVAVTASTESGRHARTEASARADVVVPEPQPAQVAAGTAQGAPATDREARDVLERLVPESTEHAAADDTADLRSRLARTAALKKPGSRERQESREDL
jgi:hypothetical protein